MANGTDQPQQQAPAPASKQATPKQFIAFGALFACLGIGLLVLCVFLFLSKKHLVEVGQRAEGTVVNVTENRRGTSTDRTNYYATVRFTTADGQEAEFTDNAPSTTKGAQRVGDRVAVLYDPAKPSDAVIADFKHIWGGPMLSGLIGFIFASLGLALLRHGLKAKKSVKMAV